MNLPLSVLNLELVRHGHDWSDTTQFIPFEQTAVAAQKAGISIGDYIDTTYNVPGATQATIDQMKALGVFAGKVDAVCEIGPGSGRYTEKTIATCHPIHYEIYETAKPWEKYVAAKYKVVPRLCDGHSLSQTPSASLDLLHAHKVFVCTPFVVTYTYFLEIARVVRPGGKVAFDVMTEECVGDSELRAWLDSGVQLGSYPNLLPKQHVIQFFTKRDFAFDGSFFVPMKPGKTECLVFTRR